MPCVRRGGGEVLGREVGKAWQQQELAMRDLGLGTR